MLSVRTISKRFGAVEALRGASLDLVPGEIRALLGANGSGKSTLVKILGGLVGPDRGTITLDGEPVRIASPRDAAGRGIAVAYQDLSVVPRLTVAANLCLGTEPRNRFGFVDRKERRRSAADALAGLDARFSSDALVSALDSSQLAQVEIARALSRRPRFLLLDEVTASMHHDHVRVLFARLRELRASGTAVLFVSHRLDEVFQVCDTATIFREGESVASVRVAEVDVGDLTFHMTGKRLPADRQAPASEATSSGSSPVLSVRDLHIAPKVRGVSLDIRPGEIVGLGGLQGQGQSAFLRGVYGAAPHRAGSVCLDGVAVTFHSPADAVKHGLGFVPGDRDRDGVLAGRSVTENLLLAEMAGKRLPSPVRPSRLAASASDLIRQLGVVAGSPGHAARTLSGGNQQKLVVGRWLQVNPRVLLLDDPTKGVDIGARNEIHDILRRMAAGGTAILIASSDNPELLALADRICVFYEGRIGAELCGDQRTEEHLVAAMLGIRDPEAAGGGGA